MPKLANSDHAICPRDKQKRQSSQHRPRSRHGCWTCRRRKVKCDETRPQCSACARLTKDCRYEFRWNFNDLTLRLQRQYDYIDASSSPSWIHKLSSLASENKARGPSKGTLCVTGNWIRNARRTRECSSTPSACFYSILTPSSFAESSEYRKISDHDDMCSPEPRSSQDARIFGLNSAVVSQLADSPQTEVQSSLQQSSSSVSLETKPATPATPATDASRFLQSVDDRSSPVPESHDKTLTPLHQALATEPLNATVEVFGRGGAAHGQFKNFVPVSLTLYVDGRSPDMTNLPHHTSQSASLVSDFELATSCCLRSVGPGFSAEWSA